MCQSQTPIDQKKTVTSVQVAEPGEFVSQRRFDEKKFTPELLKMAHIYQMSDLQSDCADYLDQTVSKENAVEAWKAAGISGSQKLRQGRV